MHKKTNAPGPLTLAAALILGLAACNTPPRGTESSYEGSDGSLEVKATEGNRELAGALSILNPRSKRLEDDRMVVEFDVKNERSRHLEFAWSVDWFDASGFHVADVSRRWEPVALAGNGQTTLTIIAPNPVASSWKLMVTSRNEVQ